MNQIKWKEWNEDTFRKAKEADKPILLGISALWCHWCHVMDQTSYSEDENIKIINTDFIPIRVDTDKRPDINRRYNMGGWPTTVFLTPQGDLIGGGTYIPPEQLRSLLLKVREYYKKNKDDLYAQISKFKEKAYKKPSERELSKSIISDTIDIISDNFDPVYGGFGITSKFPFPEALELVLSEYFRKKDESLLGILRITLDTMANRGTFDQEMGGFFRYSTNRDWSIPHFEKMCEDNAKLLSLYLKAYQLTQRSKYKETAEKIIKYVDTTLRDKELQMKSIINLIGMREKKEMHLMLIKPFILIGMQGWHPLIY